jgi:hypothetical protein
MLHRWLAGVSVKAVLVSWANLQLCFANALVDDRVLPREPHYKHDQISRIMAAAHRDYLQIRLCDIHERFPRVEALINKGIVIAHQVQSLEQRFESRHMRAKASKGPPESCTARESRRYLMEEGRGNVNQPALAASKSGPEPRGGVTKTCWTGLR